MHQMIIGSDISLRDKILHDLRSRFLRTPDALKLDFSSLDAHGLEFNELKTALLTLPAVAEMRVILISHAEKLNEECLELLDSVVSARKPPCVLVMEAVAWDKRSALRKRIADKIKISGGGEAGSIFDILHELPRNRTAVLVRLGSLLENDAVENVLGAVRWWWSHKIKGTIPAARYKKGLLVIQEADQRVKLSGMLLREQALEVALVKLSLLLKA